MKIVVFNGSPKGNLSITMQYVFYLKNNFPDSTFEIFNISQEIEGIERDKGSFEGIIRSVSTCDAVLWAFPVYVMHIPSGYKKFIELIWERECQEVFNAKYAIAFSTSIHFFDHIAGNYINSICDDLNMRYFGFYSHDMDDLLEKEKREQFLVFFRKFVKTVKNNFPTTKAFEPVVHNSCIYRPGQSTSKISANNQKIIVVADEFNLKTNLGKMIQRFIDSIDVYIDVINLSKIKINSGCIGCVSCCFDSKCAFENADDVTSAYNSLKHYDIIVFAGEIKQRFLSALWKKFIDRRFFLNHQPHFPSKQIAYIISGPLRQNTLLRELLSGQAEMEHANLAGIVTDEYNESKEIDEHLEYLAQSLISNSVNKFIAPSTFLGVGGMKIFRDNIWGRLRFIFKKDHAYYKKHGYYDFPQNGLFKSLQYSVASKITQIPSVQKAIKHNMKEHMIGQHKKVVSSSASKEI